MEIRKVVGGLAVIAALGWTSRSLADIPPPDACSTSGAKCTNVGGHDEAGICTSVECRRRTPDGDFVSYACLRCIAPTSEGEGGSGGDNAGGSGGDSGSGGTNANGGTANGGTNANGGTANGGASTGGTSANGGTANGGASTGGTSANGGSAAGGGPTSAGGMAGATTRPDDHHKKQSGCSVSSVPGKPGVASALLGFGLAALFVTRRKR